MLRASKSRRTRAQHARDPRQARAAIDPLATSSIARNTRIDAGRPGVDAAAQVVHAPKALLHETLCSGLTASTVVAVKDQRRVLVEAFDAAYSGVVEQPGLADGRDLPLLRRAHVI